MEAAIQLFDKGNNPITDWLIEINDKRLICNCDSIDYIPVGSIVDCDNFDLEWNVVPKNMFIVNKKDLINVNYKSASGCCGPDGDIMNVIDNSDRCLGNEFGDCWMSHFIIIPKGNAIVKQKLQEEIFMIFALTEYNKKQKIVDRVVGVDYYIAKQRLNLLIHERLKWEINNSKIENELKEKITYCELTDIAFQLDKLKNIDDFWLYTKFESK